MYVLIMLKILENNGTEEIGFVIPATEVGLQWWTTPRLFLDTDCTVLFGYFGKNSYFIMP